MPDEPMAGMGIIMSEYRSITSLAKRGIRTTEHLNTLVASLITLDTMLTGSTDPPYRKLRGEIIVDDEEVETIWDQDRYMVAKYNLCYKWFSYISEMFNRKGWLTPTKVMDYEDQVVEEA